MKLKRRPRKIVCWVDDFQIWRTKIVLFKVCLDEPATTCKEIFGQHTSVYQCGNGAALWQKVFSEYFVFEIAEAYPVWLTKNCKDFLPTPTVFGTGNPWVFVQSQQANALTDIRTDLLIAFLHFHFAGLTFSIL